MAKEWGERDTSFTCSKLFVELREAVLAGDYFLILKACEWLGFHRAVR